MVWVAGVTLALASDRGSGLGFLVEGSSFDFLVEMGREGA